MTRRTRNTVGLLVFLGAYGLLESSYRYLDFVTREYRISPLIPLIEQLTGVYAALAVILPAVWLVRRYSAGHWWFHLPAVIGGSTLHTLLNWGAREVLFPLAGLGPYDYGTMPTRFFMEFPSDVIAYAISAALTYLYYRQLRASELEKTLAQAQLHNLRLQLQPHFLFNTLNTISSVMYEDVRAADRMIARLSDLLRMSLEQGDAQEVTLERELEFLRLYVETMQARFEDRLEVHVDAPGDLRLALVPPLVLQPLVENSIRHGADPRSSKVNVDVSAHRSNGVLRLEVRDRGPGLTGSVDSALHRGIGLSNTAERLERLYGGVDRLGLRNAEGGGLLVTVEVPFHADPRPAGG